MEERGFELTSEDIHISYLPLSHALEFLVQCWVFINGASIGFMKGEISTLTDDIKLL